MSEKHAYDDDDITTRKRPRVCDLPGGIPMHWWLYLTRQYQDGLAGRDAGLDYHVLSQFQFNGAPPQRWYSSEKPWSGITLDDNTGRNVTRINLSGSKLVTLPESINKLKLLTHLDMNHNKLVTLPESIGDLLILNNLDVSFNKLVTLPESINKLNSLNWLNLSDNHLKVLPESINKLKSLIVLYMPNNKLVTLPESISELKSLRNMSISGNPVSSTRDKRDEISRRFARQGLYMIID